MLAHQSRLLVHVGARVASLQSPILLREQEKYSTKKRGK